jgi:phage terminase large subunit-like protein
MIDLRAEDIADLPSDIHQKLINAMSEDELLTFNRDWHFWSLEGQRASVDDWRIWVVMAGRGFGKTRIGAEWVRALAQAAPGARIALVAATLAEARSIMIEGESGILSVCSEKERPRWEASRALLRWNNGSRAQIYSGESPEGLRGPQHHYAWCDEIAKWAHPQGTWDNLQMGLRLGERPRALVTTTPRPIALMKRLLAQAEVLTRGATGDNLHLPTAFVNAMAEDYGQTRLGRQELEGELIEDIAGALWTRAMLETARVKICPALRRVVIGVDPCASVGGDACGIVAVALGEDGRAYVLEDASVGGAAPEVWAQAVAACADRNAADKVVAEANNGGNMVEHVLRSADCNMPIKRVHAAHGKAARAEPVAALYSLGKAFHVGAFPALEDELCGLISGGGYQGPGRSPDRADALVWAMTEVMLGKRGGDGPRITGF